jgi:polyphosphate kinase
MFDKKDMPFVHRDISWLSFNYRVLQEAKDSSVPLLERIKFLGIYSSNLDEFFRVRVASIKTLIRLGKKTKRQMDFSPEIILERIREIVSQQQLEFGAIYKNEILPQLAQHNIHIIRPKALESYHHAFLDRFFSEKLIQHAQPILLVKNKIRTFLPSNAIHLAVRLKTSGNSNRYAVVKIPTEALPRFVQLPDRGNGRREIMILDDILRYCLPRLFPGYSIRAAYSIKMTRDADIYIEDEYSGDLIDKIRKGIAKRNIGKGTRFVYDRKMSQAMLHFLTSTLHVKKGDLQPQGRYHNNFDFFKFPTFKLKQLQDIPLPALSHPQLSGQDRLFSIVFKQDLLLHFPYQKYEYVIRLLEQAAHDPKVTTIKIAQYRVAKDSRIIAALRSAIEQGKSVMVFMEVKARFDEAANLYWAERLESWGAKVVYSLPELKVHAKLLLIVRGKRRYAYLGTGNFNESTSQIYSDFGFMTADRRITEEVETVFDFLEYKRRPKRPFKHLLVGQFRMRRNIYQLIEQEIEHAKAGRKALIIVKLNSLQDPRMIARLYEASNAGVKIKLIIRGVCSLVPNQEGYSENIEAISIVDRYLEHTRVYYFHNNGDDQLYLSSADWMTRNLFYRIECAFPIYDAKLRKEIKDVLDIQLKDNVKARIIDGKLTNNYKEDHKSPWRSQHRLYLYYQKQLLPKIDQ